MAEAKVIQVGRYQVYLSTREVFRGDHRIKLPWRGFEALQVLIEANGEIVEREHFFARLWPGVTVTESSLNQCIAELRRDLDDPPEGGIIETVRRRGYRLSEPPEKTAFPPTNDVATEQTSSKQFLAIVGRRWIPYVLAIIVVVAALGYGGFSRSRRLQALSLTQQGLRLIRENNPPPGFGDASFLFRRAMDLDPELALAYAGLAEMMARSVESPFGQAFTFAERAVQSDPHCAECEAIAGWILWTREWQFRKAKPYLDKAVALDPKNPQILLWHAQMLACSGKLDRALEEIDKARAIDFKEPAVAVMRAGILYLSGRYEAAIVASREALGLKPNNSAAYRWIYRSSIQLDRVEEALAAKAASDVVFLGLSADSRFDMESRWTGTYHQGGLKKLVDMLSAANSSKPGLDHQRYERATWKMWIGDKQGALDELEHIFDFRPFDAIYVAVDPMFAPLHQEPRFRAVLSRMDFGA